MVKVAIAGGQGGVGRTIVDELSATGLHEVVVLSRNYNPGEFVGKKNVTGISIDYTDHKGLVKALEGVNTVLCTFFISGTGVDSTNTISQKALINAAAEAGVKRFAPSEYGGNPGDQPEKNAARTELAKYPDIETTVFMNGLFMDYFAGAKMTGHLKKFVNVVNPDTLEAFDIPGDGNDPINFTLVNDVAKFVAATIALEPGQWPKLSGMVGQTTSYNEVVETLEKIQGETYKRSFRSSEEIRKKTAPLDGLLIGIIDGVFDIPDTSNKLFPQVKTHNLEEFLTPLWGK